jgi:transcriptional regulator with XRE-family HTH domain
MAASRRPSAIHEPEYRYIIRRIREARLEAGLTLEEVATALGRHAQFVSKCELGERRIDPVDLRLFAELYDKPFDYFYPERTRKSPKRPGASKSGK